MSHVQHVIEKNSFGSDKKLKSSFELTKETKCGREWAWIDKELLFI